MSETFYYAPIRSLSLGAPFWYSFLISMVLSLIAALRLSNITPGGTGAREVGMNTGTQRRRNCVSVHK